MELVSLAEVAVVMKGRWYVGDVEREVNDLGVWTTTNWRGERCVTADQARSLVDGSQRATVEHERRWAKHQADERRWAADREQAVTDAVAETPFVGGGGHVDGESWAKSQQVAVKAAKAYDRSRPETAVDTVRMPMPLTVKRPTVLTVSASRRPEAGRGAPGRDRWRGGNRRRVPEPGRTGGPVARRAGRRPQVGRVGRGPEALLRTGSGAPEAGPTAGAGRTVGPPTGAVTGTRYVEVRRRFLREHPGHALDGWPLPMVSDDLHSMSKSPYLLRRLRRRKVLTNST